MNFKDQEQTQRHFFNHLTQRWGTELVLKGLMEALAIRRAAAYNRLNGTTALTIHEMITLTNHFQFSLDSIFQPQKYYSFEQPFQTSSNTLVFLKQFADFLQPLDLLRGKSQIIYLANELPLFYYLAHSNVFNFLFSVWSHLHDKDVRLEITENKELSQELYNIKREIAGYYSGHNVTEIWNRNMLNNLYQQILFSISVKAFKKKDFIDYLLSDIREIIKNLRYVTELSEKNSMFKSKIYFNDFGSNINAVHLSSDLINNTFVAYDYPKFIVTWNQDFHQYTKEWMEKIIKRSVLITSEAYQQREIFFNKIEKDFSIFEENVKKGIDTYY